MSEVPFPAEPECLLTVTPGEVDWITFIDPKGWRRTSIPVARGETRDDHPTLGNLWHYDLEGDVLITSPSIHAVGEWHTPNPTRWRVVTRLSDEKGAKMAKKTTTTKRRPSSASKPTPHKHVEEAQDGSTGVWEEAALDDHIRAVHAQRPAEDAEEQHADLHD